LIDVWLCDIWIIVRLGIRNIFIKISSNHVIIIRSWLIVIESISLPRSLRAATAKVMNVSECRCEYRVFLLVKVSFVYKYKSRMLFLVTSNRRGVLINAHGRIIGFSIFVKGVVFVVSVASDRASFVESEHRYDIAFVLQTF